MLLLRKRWFTPPVFPDDDEKNRRARVLNITLVTALVYGCILTLTHWLHWRSGQIPMNILMTYLGGVLFAGLG